MGRSAWQDGRRAWQRLNGWHRDGGPGDHRAADARQALVDIRLVRGLLDQAEMGAVRAARRDNRPWGEIATMLGVTRQSAWERWRDLVEVDGPDEAPAADTENLLGLVTRELLRDRRRGPLRESIQLVKHRIGHERGLLAVRFEDSGGRPYISFWGVDRSSTKAWGLGGGGYSSRLDGSPTSELWQRTGGWGDGQRFSFGGVPADPNVRRVRLSAGDLDAVDDVADDGVVLFSDWRGGRDSTVEMFDRDDTLLHSGPLR